MYAFDLVQPKTLEDALAVLRDDVEPRLLAGGQTLLPALKHRLAAHSTLIDLQHIEALGGISVSDSEVRLGAMTRHADVAASTEVRAAIPALAVLAGGIGDPLVRNMGTIGGSIANNDPASDYPAAILALNAVVETDRREIEADAFFDGMFETALEPDEVIVAVRFPVPDRAGYMKLPHPASGYVLAGAFVADFGGDVRAALNGITDCAFRDERLEAALVKSFTPDAIADIAFDPDDLNADAMADGTYRMRVLPHVIASAVKRALGAS